MVGQSQLHFLEEFEMILLKPQVKGKKGCKQMAKVHHPSTHLQVCDHFDLQ